MSVTEQPVEQRIADLLERIGRLQQAAMYADDLVPAQWQALRYLGRANKASRIPSALAQYLGSTKGTVSQTLITLEKRNLIRKTENVEDRRSVTLELTEKGRQALAKDPMGELANLWQSIPADRKAELAAGLEQALAALVKRSGGREFGLCSDCRHFGVDVGENGESNRHRCCRLGMPLAEADGLLVCSEHQSCQGEPV